MAYYSSEACHYINNTDWQISDCTISYTQSDIKYVVDAWKKVEAPAASEARLITIIEMVDNLGYEWFDNGSVAFWIATESTPNWVYNSNYSYWTMSQYNDLTYELWYAYNDGKTFDKSVYDQQVVVRPVIVLSKSVL